MNEDNKKFLYHLDEFGRVVIEDEKVLKIISGANKSEELLNKTNLGCGLNKVCANKECSKVPPW